VVGRLRDEQKGRRSGRLWHGQSKSEDFGTIKRVRIVKEHGTMSTIHFEAKLFDINSWIILRLPEDASEKLPSRGMTMVSGTINGVPFKTLLEPDGRYASGQKPSHWFRPDKTLLADASATAGDTVHVSLEPTTDWIEPEVPEDVQKALATSPKAEALWEEITPLARWDWIRWIRAVKTPETRQKHIDVALDKLNKGMRRPCCFNRNLCSEPSVSHNWMLLDPREMKEQL
jgi:Bacteriocin-protection, YdeI or OmpD-Associated/Domain of unknown function (DUF1905)